MYKKIKAHDSVVQKYGRRLVDEGLLSEEAFASARAVYRAQLDEAFEAANSFKPNKADWLDGKWSGLQRKSAEFVRGDTGVEESLLREVGAGLTRVPDGFNLHRALTRQLKAKDQMFESGPALTGRRLKRWLAPFWKAIRCVWLAKIASAARFARHSSWIDQETERRFKPLEYIRDEQALLK